MANTAYTLSKQNIITANIVITYNVKLKKYDVNKIRSIAQRNEFKINESKTSYKKTSIFIRNEDIQKIERQLEKIQKHISEDEIGGKIKMLDIAVNKGHLKTKIAVIAASTINIFLLIVFVGLLSSVRTSRGVNAL